MDMKKLALTFAAVAAGVGTNAATFYASPNPVDPSTEGYCETESAPGTIRDALARCTGMGSDGLTQPPRE